MEWCDLTQESSFEERSSQASGHFVERRVTFVKESAAREAKKMEMSDAPDVAECVEAVFGCKWSIRILTLIRRGVCRPGEIERSLAGLTTKVQHHYFRRMVSLGILRREVYAEVPPRVEYRLTPFGEQFVPLLEQIERLQKDLASQSK
jgi:DNA-binding HxlR family transcriptional regulator